LGAKARAILHGRYAVTADDIRAMAFPVLRHRIFTNFNADAEGIDVEQVVERILEAVPEPSYGEPVSGRVRTARPAPAAAEAASPTSTMTGGMGATVALPPGVASPGRLVPPAPARPAPSAPVVPPPPPTR
jgi:MoxR-like ATPase